MPEILEIEYYRRSAEPCIGRKVKTVDAPDSWYLKKGLDAANLKGFMEGQRVEAVNRIGKLLLLRLEPGTVGLRFGMTGRLIVDGSAVIDRLEYAPFRDNPDWDRLTVHFFGGGSLKIQDPRRLGGVILEPDLGHLGIDAFYLDGDSLKAALGSSKIALKARLMDQARIAGLGNLLVDEILWRAGLSPRRIASSVSNSELGTLLNTISAVLAELFERGGSHTGDLQDQRHRDGRCPLDGELLFREQVGGRTTYWCPAHQS